MSYKSQNILNNILSIFHLSDGLLHWIVQRSSALLILFGVFFSFTFDNLYFFILISIVITFHVSVGIRTLIDDYIHDDILHLVSVTFLRISLLFLLKAIFILLLC